jgi:hypothetical protein
MLILTNERLLSPTSPEVTRPHGILVERYGFHGMVSTVSPPKYTGKAADRAQLKIHCIKK